MCYVLNVLCIQGKLAGNHSIINISKTVKKSSLSVLPTIETTFGNELDNFVSNTF